MKAVILAGGFGQRLRPLSEFIPKPLLPVGGKPLLDHIIEKVLEVDEIDKIYISTNKFFENHFRYWLEKTNLPQIELVVEPTVSEGEKLGAIGGLNFLLSRSKINDDLLVIAGDNFFDFDLKGFVKFFKQKRGVIVGVYQLEEEEALKRFGVVSLEGDKVKVIQEKPTNPLSNLISTGCYILPKESLSLIPSYIANGYNPDAPGYFFEWLIKNKDVFAFKFTGLWFDIGNIEAYRKLNNLFW